MKDLRAYVDSELVVKIKRKYFEAESLSATGVVDWALRKLITEAK